MGLQLSQQVNLFQSEFHIRNDLICAKNVQKLLIATIVFLTLISAFDYIRTRNQNSYLTELQAKHSELEIALQKAKQVAPSMIVDNSLKQRVESYQRDVGMKQQVLDALSGQSFGNTTGFSDYFKSLANQNVTGLWLTKLTISSGGKDIGLSGSAFHPGLVPDFLSKLSTESIFQGTNFQTFRVKREENPIRVDFYVNTQFVEVTP